MAFEMRGGEEWEFVLVALEGMLWIDCCLAVLLRGLRAMIRIVVPWDLVLISLVPSLPFMYLRTREVKSWDHLLRSAD